MQVTDAQKGLVKEVEDLVSVQQFILQQGDEGVFVSLVVAFILESSSSSPHVA